MGKKLAIRGHSTRGKEVIELLQMMGGTNPFSKNDGMVIGNKTTNCYYISEDTSTKYISWDYIGPEEIDKYEIFTLEEFLEKYPYKVGDKIPDVWGNSCTVKSMSWDENYKTVMYGFEETIFVVRGDELKPVNDMGLKIENGINMNIEFDLAKYSYEIKDGKLVVSEKTPKYPNNYEDCVRIAKNIHGYDIHIDAPAYRELLESFVKLLICHDAYWRIAGEEMELGKPWEPDWNDSIPKYTIVVIGNDLVKHYTFAQNFILAFPTEEMRDIFYENFKDLIEQCKELL